MDKISLSLARNQVSDAYKTDVEDAAGDAVLSKSEQATLSPWAAKVAEDLRATTSGPLKAKDVYVAINGKVRRALTAISSDKYNITRAEAKTLYVAELRAKVLDLFPPKATDTAALEAAIDATDIDEMTDYNKGFSVKSYGKGADLAEIAEDLTGEEMGEDSWLDFTKTKKGAEEFAGFIRDQGETEEENADTPALGKKLRKLHDAVADAAEALFGDTKEFSELHYHYNGVVEDGATEWAILIGKRTDGSWTAVTYSNFPF